MLVGSQCGNSFRHRSQNASNRLAGEGDFGAAFQRPKDCAVDATKSTSGLSILFPRFKDRRIVRSMPRNQWEAAGEALGSIGAKLNWYLGDWLKACKGEAWGYGELEGICEKFGVNYQTAMNAKSVCVAFEFSRRRENLTFAHHQEVQGRDDADELLDWCLEEDPPRSQKELREKKRERKNIQLAARDLPVGKYSVIYADPPWEYNSGDQHANEAQETVLSTHYPSMPLELICKMAVADLAADGCVLFIWTTSPTSERCGGRCF